MEPRPSDLPTHDVGESLGHSSLTRRGLMALAGAGMALGALGESTALAATQSKSEGARRCRGRLEARAAPARRRR